MTKWIALLTLAIANAAIAEESLITRIAQERMAEFVDAASNSASFGFNKEDAASAALGTPIPMLTLDDAKAAYSTSSTLEDFLVSDTVWLVPVKVKGVVIGYLHLEKNASGEFKAVEFGYNGLATRMDKLSPKKGKAYIVQSCRLTHFFLHTGNTDDDLTAYSDFDNDTQCATDPKICLKHKAKTFVRIQSKLKEGREWNAK